MRWSAESVKKAEDLVDSEKVRRDKDHDDVFFVEGSTEIYRVQTDGESWITCNCPNGMHLSRPVCYHTAAVLIRIRDERAAMPPDPDNVEIDFSGWEG